MFEVWPEARGQRLDQFVGKALGLSRARLRRLFESGAVRVDGRAGKKGDRVEPWQKVRVVVGPQSASALPDPAMALIVLHADDALVFVDKPAGVPSHPLRPAEMGTAANALLARFPECASASQDPREGGLCHRLDIETSGVLLAARSREAWLRARAAFAQEEVDKRYWALVSGPIADQGEIEIPLRHHRRRKDRVEPARAGEPGSRPARSLFRVLSRAGPHSLVEVRIVTGVLHQVRAHLAAIGAPVIGDRLYGVEPLDEPSRSDTAHPEPLDVARDRLQARAREPGVEGPPSTPLRYARAERVGPCVDPPAERVGSRPRLFL
ncbi:MAG TPA: RluA family pseudouridine synthase, partial [Myxococcaceae bacterium]|nr:RluA family pseudouridine synthase [Myxococcaceae bacterium]